MTSLPPTSSPTMREQDDDDVDIESSSSMSLGYTPYESSAHFSSSKRNDIEASVLSSSSNKSLQHQQQQSMTLRRESMMPPMAPNLPWPFNTWSAERWRVSLLGCTSAAVVLTIRLILDTSPLAYLIHSIIVFCDMILIHICTHCRWLSISGELVTIVFFLAFHFTKETLYELLETTIIAVLVSIYLINTRKDVMEERDALEEDVERLQRRGALILRNINQVQHELDKDCHENCKRSAMADTELTRELMGSKQAVLTKSQTFSQRVTDWFVPPQHEECHMRVRWAGNTFFEYFLDGAAGVLYTSFLGLIIDQIINYGNKK